MSIIVAVLIFSLIILFHEFGHFLFAKLGGITVTEFSLGMGPRLLSFEMGGTRYSLKALPIGGSCAMLGEDEDDMQEGSFGSKSVWTRILVVAAGPLFNFILAYVISVILLLNAGCDLPVLLAVSEGYPAEQAGLQPGDVITQINGKNMYLYRDVSNYVSFHQERLSDGTPVTVRFTRDGEKHTVSLTAADDGNGRYILGVSGSSSYREKLGFFRTLRYGLYEVRFWVGTTLGSLRLLLTGKAGAQDLSGPVGVVSMIGETYEESRTDGWYYVMLNMMNISILLSANLGVMNLLPLPALDGGRLLFLILEVIRRKRIDPGKEGMVHFAGFMLLMLLMVFVLFNDIRRIVMGG